MYKLKKLFTSLPPSRQEQNTLKAKAELQIDSEESTFNSRERIGGRDYCICCLRTDD